MVASEDGGQPAVKILADFVTPRRSITARAVALRRIDTGLLRALFLLLPEEAADKIDGIDGADIITDPGHIMR